MKKKVFLQLDSGNTLNPLNSYIFICVCFVQLNKKIMLACCVGTCCVSFSLEKNETTLIETTGLVL